MVEWAEHYVSLTIWINIITLLFQHYLMFLLPVASFFIFVYFCVSYGFCEFALSFTPVGIYIFCSYVLLHLSYWYVSLVLGIALDPRI